MASILSRPQCVNVSLIYKIIVNSRAFARHVYHSAGLKSIDLVKKYERATTFSYHLEHFAIDIIPTLLAVVYSNGKYTN